MVNDTRVSNFFPNPLKNQLAIVHRQGTDASLFIIGFLVLVELIRIVITARNIPDIEFPLFFGLVFSGFILYLIVTILLRRFSYTSVIHGQGIYHPKLIISIPVALFASTAFIDARITIVLNFFVVLVGIDVLIQNQVHDIVTRIGPNSWEINAAIPIFQIPFERDIKIEPNDLNQFNLVMKVGKKQLGFLPPRTESIDEIEVTKLLDSDEQESPYDYYGLYIADPNLGKIPQGNHGLIQFYLTKNLSELKEMIYEMKNLVNFQFLSN